MIKTDNEHSAKDADFSNDLQASPFRLLKWGYLAIGFTIAFITLLLALIKVPRTVPVNISIYSVVSPTYSMSSELAQTLRDSLFSKSLHTISSLNDGDRYFYLEPREYLYFARSLLTIRTFLNLLG